ncbi:hypothetical protein Q1W70_26095 [Pseudomonas kielensis]|jgi:hypothetical protein|uniref:hypothetical protein n=1 Tax=Pseudomonas TaxID=286 RepID=UPI0014130E1B|nr:MULTISPECIES: hypothetical protein [Pseudomonas]NBB33135.1 hypothetical protein [Pseudomonas sp. BC115LW]WKL52846.1 hypothetical protein Q1W70_26095 [Pseudomonas kielensis]
MRKKIIAAVILAAAAHMPYSLAESPADYPNVGDEGLAFSIQAKQGSSWVPMKSQLNSAARACIFGNPRCYLKKGVACEPFAMKIEGPGGVRELKCMGSRTDHGDADKEDIQRAFNRAQYEAKGSSAPMVGK